MEPLTFTLITAATTIGSAFIGIVPDIVKIVAERKSRASSNVPSVLEEERATIQKELEHIKRDIQQDRIERSQILETCQTESSQAREDFELSRKASYGESLIRQKQLEQQLAVYNRQTQLELAEHHRKTTLQLAEVNKLFENWPLTVVPSQILEAHRNRSVVPLRIFISPPRIQSERSNRSNHNFSQLEPSLAQGLGEFLDKHYSFQSSDRPTEFLGGAWDSKRSRREASIKALFSMLQSEPTLVMESEVINQNEISLRVGYWGIGQETYCYQSVAKLPYRDILCESARARAIKWKENKCKLRGKSLVELSEIGGDNDTNLQILEKEEQLRANGINTEELPIHQSYKINDRDIEAFSQILIACHCLIAGWITDAYFFIHYDTPPLLPKLISDITNEVRTPQALQPIIQGVVTGYRMLYASLTDERPSWIPELSLGLAKSLASLSDKSWSREQAYHSIKSWLKQRQVSPPEGLEALEVMQSVVTIADRKYLEDVRECFAAIGDTDVIPKILELDWKIKLQQRETEVLYQQGLECGRVGRYREALNKFNQIIPLNPSSTEAHFSRAFVYGQLNRYHQSIADYTVVLQLQPSYTEAYVNRGNAYYKVGNYEAALQDYEQALYLNPSLSRVDQYCDDTRRKLRSR